MAELTGFLNTGRYDLFIIFGLLLYSIWVTKQWRDAEKGRIGDLRDMVELATEVKNNVATLVALIQGNNQRRTR